MVKWEYIVHVLPATTPVEHQRLLNDYGFGGWELVTVVHDNIQVITYFFKRPLDRVVH